MTPDCPELSTTNRQGDTMATYGENLTRVQRAPRDVAKLRRQNLTAGVLAELAGEREAQHEKWGIQNLPDGTDASNALGRDAIRAVVDLRAADGTLAWADVVLEEFWEVMSETEPAPLRAELVQLGAVVAAWIEAIDRRSP